MMRVCFEFVGFLVVWYIGHSVLCRVPVAITVGSVGWHTLVT